MLSDVLSPRSEESSRGSGWQTGFETSPLSPATCPVICRTQIMSPHVFVTLSNSECCSKSVS